MRTVNFKSPKYNDLEKYPYPSSLGHNCEVNIWAEATHPHSTNDTPAMTDPVVGLPTDSRTSPSQTLWLH